MKNVGHARGLEMVLQLTLRGWFGAALWMEFSSTGVGMSLSIPRSLLDSSGISVFLSLKALATGGAMLLGLAPSKAEQFSDFSSGDKMTLAIYNHRFRSPWSWGCLAGRF